MSSLSDETHFDKTGTLHKPGPIGRIVRLLLGGWLLYGFWIFWTYPGLVVREELPHSSTWRPRCWNTLARKRPRPGTL